MAMTLAEAARLAELERKVEQLAAVVGEPKQVERKKPGPKPKVANAQAVD